MFGAIALRARCRLEAGFAFVGHGTGRSKPMVGLDRWAMVLPGPRKRLTDNGGAGALREEHFMNLGVMPALLQRRHANIWHANMSPVHRGIS